MSMLRRSGLLIVVGMRSYDGLQKVENLVHQATAGLQWIHRRWVLEGGVVQDLNASEDTRLVLSMRIHF